VVRGSEACSNARLVRCCYHLGPMVAGVRDDAGTLLVGNSINHATSIWAPNASPPPSVPGISARTPWWRRLEEDFAGVEPDEPSLPCCAPGISTWEMRVRAAAAEEDGRSSCQRSSPPLFLLQQRPRTVPTRGCPGSMSPTPLASMQRPRTVPTCPGSGPLLVPPELRGWIRRSSKESSKASVCGSVRMSAKRSRLASSLKEARLATAPPHGRAPRLQTMGRQARLLRALSRWERQEAKVSLAELGDNDKVIVRGRLDEVWQAQRDHHAALASRYQKRWEWVKVEQSAWRRSHDALVRRKWGGRRPDSGGRGAEKGAAATAAAAAAARDGTACGRGGDCGGEGLASSSRRGSTASRTIASRRSSKGRTEPQRTPSVAASASGADASDAALTDSDSGLDTVSELGSLHETNTIGCPDDALADMRPSSSSSSCGAGLAKSQKSVVFKPKRSSILYTAAPHPGTRESIKPLGERRGSGDLRSEKKLSAEHQHQDAGGGSLASSQASNSPSRRGGRHLSAAAGEQPASPDSLPPTPSRAARSFLRQKTGSLHITPGQQAEEGGGGLGLAAGGGDVDVAANGSTALDSPLDLAQKYGLPIEEVWQRQQEFTAFDSIGGCGVLTEDEFALLVRKRCNLSPTCEIPQHLLNRHRSSARDVDSDIVTFEDYILWTVNTAYSEEMLVTDLAERKLREFARRHDFLLPDVEMIKEVFDRFDNLHEGVLDEKRFRLVLFQLLDVRNPSDISAKKMQRYWREVDRDRSGSVAFQEFLLWYLTFFDG